MPKVEAKGGSSRKRGKSEAENGKREVDFDEDGEEAAPRVKRVRFPKGKKEKDAHKDDGASRTLGIIEGEEDDGPELSTDPRLAALERATRREKGLEQIRAEDTSVSNDVALAEEEYDEDEEIGEDGTMIEPFNLKQEREEGYFDAEGNYVEYRNEDDTKDAWLDSVDSNVRHTGKAVAQPADNEEDDKELSKEEVGGIKRRIADALEPGETVLRALRRLKGMARDSNTTDRMTGETKALFDKLTEDAMKLLDNGDYNVYEETKETFQREAEGYEALSRLRSGVSNGAGPSGASLSSVPGQASSDAQGLPSASIVAAAGSNVDMFGEADNDEDLDMFGDGVKGTENGEVHAMVQQDSSQPQGNAPMEGSGYVFDSSSGYYYNSELGYYYDANSGLYCNASTGKWYKFDEQQNSYEEYVQ